MNSIVTPFHPKNGCILTCKKNRFFYYFFHSNDSQYKCINLVFPLLFNEFIYLFIYLVNFQFALV